MRVIGRLPTSLAHAAGVAVGGTFFVLGGRGDSPNSQSDSILAVDPRGGGVSPGGRLPAALSDLSAAVSGGRALVAGGRDPSGAVHDELLVMRAR